MFRDKDKDVREEAAQTLGKLQPAALAQHAAALVAMLKDIDPRVRSVAVEIPASSVRALSQHAEAFVAKLEDIDPWVRSAAVEILGVGVPAASRSTWAPSSPGSWTPMACARFDLEDPGRAAAGGARGLTRTPSARS